MSVAKGERAMLTLVHVVDSASAQVYGDVYDEHTRDDEQYLLEIAEEVRALGIAVEIALVHGDPSRELIAFASATKSTCWSWARTAIVCWATCSLARRSIRCAIRWISRFWWCDSGEKSV